MSHSHDAHESMIVDRLKAFTSPTSATTLARLTAGHVYATQAPAAAPFPMVVVRKMNQQSDLQISGRENFEIEVMVHHRPAVKESACHAIADLIVQALMSWKHTSPDSGITFTQGYRRDRLPLGTSEPGKEEVVTIRLVFPAVTWPRYVTAAL